MMATGSSFGVSGEVSSFSVGDFGGVEWDSLMSDGQWSSMMSISYWSNTMSITQWSDESMSVTSSGASFGVSSEVSSFSVGNFGGVELETMSIQDWDVLGMVSISQWSSVESTFVEVMGLNFLGVSGEVS